jgi:hypothetical protein
MVRFIQIGQFKRGQDSCYFNRLKRTTVRLGFRPEPAGRLVR